MEIVLEYKELGTLNITGGSNSLIQKPVKIYGVKGTDFAHYVANYSLIAKDFVKTNEITILPVKRDIRGGTGKQMVEREGTETVLVQNGAVRERIKIEIIDFPDGSNMVIGLPDFRLFGYRIEGVPVKRPSNENITTDVT